MELTTTQIAARLGVSERTVQRWIADGKLKAQRIAHHRYLIEESDLNALISPQGKELQTQFAVSQLEIRSLKREVEGLKQRISKLEQRLDKLNKD